MNFLNTERIQPCPQIKFFTRRIPYLFGAVITSNCSCIPHLIGFGILLAAACAHDVGACEHALMCTTFNRLGMETTAIRSIGIEKNNLSFFPPYSDSLLATIQPCCICILQYWSDSLLAMMMCSSCFHQILDRSSGVSVLICSCSYHQILDRSSVVSVLISIVSMV